MGWTNPCPVSEPTRLRPYRGFVGGAPPFRGGCPCPVYFHGTTKADRVKAAAFTLMWAVPAGCGLVQVGPPLVVLVANPMLATVAVVAVLSYIVFLSFFRWR